MTPPEPRTGPRLLPWLCLPSLALLGGCQLLAIPLQLLSIGVKFFLQNWPALLMFLAPAPPEGRGLEMPTEAFAAADELPPADVAASALVRSGATITALIPLDPSLELDRQALDELARLLSSRTGMGCLSVDLAPLRQDAGRAEAFARDLGAGALVVTAQGHQLPATRRQLTIGSMGGFRAGAWSLEPQGPIPHPALRVAPQAPVPVRGGDLRPPFDERLLRTIGAEMSFAPPRGSQNGGATSGSARLLRTAPLSVADVAAVPAASNP